MPVNILMPALSPTMEKGNLAKWLKKEGDKVRSGDVIAEIETDKATMEVEAVDEGVLAKIMVPAGAQDVAVNSLIAVLASEGEDPAIVGAAGAASGGEVSAPATPKAEAAAAPAPVAASPIPATAPAPAANGAPAASKVFASPLAKRLAKAAGIDITRVAGSGPHGRIIARDVEGAKSGAVPLAAAPAVAAAPAPQAAKPAPAPVLAPSMGADQVKAMFEAGSYEEVPVDGMRKTIARRLTESKQTVPHFYLTVDVELDALMKLREQLNAAAPLDKDKKPAFKLSVNDFVIKGLALALRQVPDANACWAEDRILKFRHSDVGVAVAIPGGLFTPVIRKAEQKTLSAISNEMKDFAARARTRKLLPHEYQGGSTSVSNLGMYGVKDFAAVINPPHGTILAVGAGEQRAVVRNGQLAVATVMSVTLSCDHRVVDGALGAELLAAFRTLLEAPIGMLV